MAKSSDSPTLIDAEEAFERGDIEAAMMICEGLIGENERKAPVELLYLAAECLLEIQEPTEALHLLDLALGKAGPEPVLIHARGISLFEIGRFAEARECFAEVVEQQPDLGEALYYMGVLAERAGETQEAEQLFSRAVDVDPENLVHPRDWPEKAVRKIFGEIIDEMPDALSQWLSALPVDVDDLPADTDLVRDGVPISPLVLCTFAGGSATEPQSDDPTTWFQDSPERIKLYRWNLGKCALDDYELHHELLEAVLWEVMDFLGLSQEHIQKLGLSPRVDEDPLDV